MNKINAPQTFIQPLSLILHSLKSSADREAETAALAGQKQSR